MKAYNYEKPGVAKLIDKEKPVVTESTDAIIRMVKTTICGTDLHIIKAIHLKFLKYNIRSRRYRYC